MGKREANQLSVRLELQADFLAGVWAHHAQRMKHILDQNDIENLTLEVRASNRGAQEMYRRFGFAPGGVRRNYYVENNEDAIVMWAHDIDGDEYAARLAAIERQLPVPTIMENID